MAEIQKDASSTENGQGQNNKPTCTACTVVVSCIPFVAGIALALVIGWWVYPTLLFAERQQPIAFNHQVHLVKNGMACSDCHTLRDDGSYRGLPTTADCATCHSSVQGNSATEKRFVEDYVQKGKEVPWLVYQWQPDNVFFSHAAHSVESCNTCHDFTTTELCNLCHLDLASTTTPPPFFENRITGYSKTTMKMNLCERCHAYPDHLNDTNANNSCFVCHK